MIVGSISDWYRDDFGFSVGLIDTFVGLIEKQTEDAIHNYRTEKKLDVVEDDVEDYGIHGHPVESYGGLDSDSYDVKSVFEEHFPSLQRRSAMITVYGYFEHELVRLCNLFKDEKQLSLSFSDLKDDGIQRSTNYLQKVAHLNVHKNSPTWKSINRVRIIRNMVVHRDVRLRDSQGRIPSEVNDAVTNLKHLRTTESEIVLEMGFVAQVVDIFKAYFKLIDDSIQEEIRDGR